MLLTARNEHRSARALGADGRRPPQAKIPVWADRSGLGWLMRCLYEPRKFIPRYISALPLVWMVARYREKSPVGAQ